MVTRQHIVCTSITDIYVQYSLHITHYPLHILQWYSNIIHGIDIIICTIIIISYNRYVCTMYHYSRYMYVCTVGECKACTGHSSRL